MQTAVISTVGFVTRPSHMDLGRIAIFRPLGLERLLTATPALRAVRTALPEAEVTYIGDPESGQAVGRFADYIDDFMLCPPYPGLHAGTGDAASILDFLQLAQVRRFDLAIQLHGCGLISNPRAPCWGPATPPASICVASTAPTRRDFWSIRGTCPRRWGCRSSYSSQKPRIGAIRWIPPPAASSAGQAWPRRR